LSVGQKENGEKSILGRELGEALTGPRQPKVSSQCKSGGTMRMLFEDWGRSRLAMRPESVRNVEAIAQDNAA